jgi:hypothetical protein
MPFFKKIKLNSTIIKLISVVIIIVIGVIIIFIYKKSRAYSGNSYSKNPSIVFNKDGGWRMPFSETGVCESKYLNYSETTSADLRDNINSNNKKYQIELVQEYVAGTAKSVQINVPGNILLRSNDMSIWSKISTEEKVSILKDSLKFAQQKYSKKEFNISIGYCHSDLNKAEINKTKWLAYLGQNNGAEDIFIDWEN